MQDEFRPSYQEDDLGRIGVGIPPNITAKAQIDMNVIARSKKNYQVEISAGNHRWVADEPRDVGDDAGPNPYDLLLGALGACKVITVQMYARKKGWPLEGVEVALSIHKIHAKDCEDCESDPNAKIDIIECEIGFQGELTPEQIQRLTEISERCPVHQTLVSETKIRTRLGVARPGN